MKIAPTLGFILAATSSAMTHANICNTQPGSMTCGQGEVSQISSNGMVTINGSTVIGDTLINGVLYATDCNLHALTVNGTGSLIQCTINELAKIKGSVTASSTKFESGLQTHSNITRLINSKVTGDLTILHSGDQAQIVYLDTHSEVSGNIHFEDGNGQVILRGGSAIKGQVVGGKTITQ